MAHRSRQTALFVAAALAVTLVNSPRARGAAHAASLPTMTVTGVAADNSSAKIDFLPVTGAKDYRIYDVSNPMSVKYAGMTHLDAGSGNHFVMMSDGVTPVFPYAASSNRSGGTGPQTLDVPGTEIQWNLLDDGAPHKLVAQALDNLGPVPPANLADFTDNAINPPAGMLGANDGATPDGNMSINGQGASTNAPHVIAQSAPFVVQANKSLRALPSGGDATQSFFDTFDTSENGAIAPNGTANPRTGVMTYTLNAGTPRAWDILYHNADTVNNMPFVTDGHFMDLLFDGVTPSAVPKIPTLMHTQYASMSLSPQPTADLSNGKLVHLTMEVDSHLESTHRWLAWQVAPATDPITNFVDDDYVTNGFSKRTNIFPPNHTDKAMWVQLFPGVCDAMLFERPTSPTNPAPVYNQFIQQYVVGHTPPCAHSENWGGNGIGFDNRNRWDLFFTTSHMAVFEDGQLIVQADIPDGGLGFTQAKLYFTHYLYATTKEHQHLPTTAPYETNWINNFPYSDERHWDNMGFEVLPASDVPANNDFSSLASRIVMP